MTAGDYEPIYGDDGQLLGVLAEADDGAVVSVDLEGRVLAAYDPSTGEQLDPDAYELDQGDEDVDPRIAEYDARLADLEQRASEPMPMAPYVSDAEFEEAVANDLDGQLESLETMRGHALTRSELRAVMGRVREDIDAGRPVNVYAALERADMEGQPIADLDDRQQRHAWIAERLQDQERDQRDQDLDEPDPPATEWADLDNGDERRAWIADRMAGRVDGPESSAYSSSDYTDAEGGDAE
jgi:hypothetical protein